MTNCRPGAMSCLVVSVTPPSICRVMPQAATASKPAHSTSARPTPSTLPRRSGRPAGAHSCAASWPSCCPGRGGCRLDIAGDLAQGSGLSSSAALEAALCLALPGARGRSDRRELAQLCSRVENDWAGANTGLLDQLASLLRRAGHALRIDFATLEIDAGPARRSATGRW